MLSQPQCGAFSLNAASGLGSGADPSRAVDTVLTASSPRCPYQGLVPYVVDDSGGFFGRDADVATCLRRLGGVTGVRFLRYLLSRSVRICWVTGRNFVIVEMNQARNSSCASLSSTSPLSRSMWMRQAFFPGSES
jgi:hypothetical protein